MRLLWLVLYDDARAEDVLQMGPLLAYLLLVLVYLMPLNLFEPNSVVYSLAKRTSAYCED